VSRSHAIQQCVTPDELS